MRLERARPVSASWPRWRRETNRARPARAPHRRSGSARPRPRVLLTERLQVISPTPSRISGLGRARPGQPQHAQAGWPCLVCSRLREGAAAVSTGQWAPWELGRDQRLEKWMSLGSFHALIGFGRLSRRLRMLLLSDAEERGLGGGTAAGSGEAGAGPGPVAHLPSPRWHSG